MPGTKASESVPLLPVSGDTSLNTVEPTAPSAPRRINRGTPFSNDLGLSPEEDSPAYLAIRSLLSNKYRCRSPSDLDLIQPNSNRFANLAGCIGRCCGVQTFEVSDGCLRMAEDGSGKFLIYGPGVHWIHNPFMRLVGRDVPISTERIIHGDRTIITVNQGHVGYAEDMGFPVLIPPGLHEWTSPTLKFKHSVDLNNSVIKLGPYTIITVDEGYAAITQNNGKQVILPGGTTHLLSHRNWKFEKMMTEKIQTDDLERIEATSADNVKMHTVATVVWRVTEVKNAALMSAETMQRDGGEASQSSQGDIKKLRKDVLKQATACLAAFIGEIRYSDSFHLSAAASGTVSNAPVPKDLADYSPIWDTERMASSVASANLVTKTYGVTVLSINIISAVPADGNLQNALAAGAVASAEAEQAETIARGKARAARIMAEGDAEASIIRAEGSRKAAECLTSSAVGVELARLDKLNGILGDKTCFFFGADQRDLSGLLSNPGIVSTGQ